MLSNLRYYLPLLLLTLTACGPDLREGVTEAYAELPERVDFNFHVKPILSDRCYACHGPDEQKQEADLRLDNATGAYAALTSGHGYAIVPGKPSQSEMIARINSDDPELVMPTPESNLSLTDEEIAILTKWVEQGAEYKEHWAFVPPVKPAVPAAGQDWAKNEIDRFI
ncbi:MAG: c-type cytochrome domain-containing protein, partial [Bacteroidota bacterium]